MRLLDVVTEKLVELSDAPLVQHHHLGLKVSVSRRIRTRGTHPIVVNDGPQAVRYGENSAVRKFATGGNLVRCSRKHTEG